MTDTAKLREALEVIESVAGGTDESSQFGEAVATLRDFIERGLPFYEAALECCVEMENWPDGTALHAAPKMMDAYRAMQQGEKTTRRQRVEDAIDRSKRPGTWERSEKVVLPCNCNEYEGSGVDVLNCPVHGKQAEKDGK